MAGRSVSKEIELPAIVLDQFFTANGQKRKGDQHEGQPIISNNTQSIILSF